MKYIILKVDTSGLNPETADVVRVSAIRVDGDNRTTFDKFVNPGYHIPEEASKVSGIYDKDVDGQPYFDSLKKDLVDFIGDLPIIGHNVSFDLAFINKYLDEPLKNKSMSIMDMARSFGYDGSLKFLAMCKHYNVPYYMHYNVAEKTDMLFQAVMKDYLDKKKDNLDV